MKISVLFWNIWLNNQLKGSQNSQELLEGFKSIVETYQPDCIGLNEVLKNKDEQFPFVVKFLEQLGYKHTHFAPASPLSDEWTIGVAVCSKYPLGKTSNIELGKDIWANYRGYPNETVKAIATKIRVSGTQELNLITAHIILLRPSTLKEHYKQSKALTNVLKKPAYLQNTIIGGDFNEPKFMPKSFKSRNKATHHHQTGTFLNPTWKYDASNKTLIRANLDRLFWSKEGSLELLKFEVVDTNISDHKPIYAVFDLNG